MNNKQLSQTLNEEFGGILLKNIIANDEVTIEVEAENLLDVCQTLRDQSAFQFEQLIDVCAVDYLEYGNVEWSTETSSATGFSRGVTPATNARLRFGDEVNCTNNMPSRFASVYHLLSISHNHRLRIRVFLQDDAHPIVPSVIEIWPVANWFEREAFDLYGVLYDGHPDLRRILTDYGFVGHPFRKDFPLIGHVEMKYDETQKRVVYQPVSIDPRVLVPKIIRDDGLCASASPDATLAENTDA